MPKKRLQIIIGSLITLLIVVNLYVFRDKLTFLADMFTNTGTTEVANLTDNRGDYPGGNIPKYEKFELTFDINRLDAPGGILAHNLNIEVDNGDTNPYWPYEENPVPNEYWNDPANTQNWAGDGTYFGGSSRVIHNGTLYACRRDHGVWKQGNNYRHGQIATYESKVYRFDMPKLDWIDVEAKANSYPTSSSLPLQHEGADYTWIEVPEYGSSVEPNGSGNWQEYWLPNPPDPIPAGQGISVDGLFLPQGQTDWNNAVVQPAFYYQDYTRDDYWKDYWRDQSNDWIYPVGKPMWKIRFAPTTDPGTTYQYKIRITDRTGVTYFSNDPNNTFAVASSDNKGFVKVSEKDPRYFETSDGSYINFVGQNQTPTTTYGMDEVFSTAFKEKGINLLRPWWQVSGGPQVFGISGQAGPANWCCGGPGFTDDPNIVKEGELLAYKYDKSHYLDKDGINQNKATTVYVKPSTRYVFSAWIKTENLVGTGDFGIQLRTYVETTYDHFKGDLITQTDGWINVQLPFETNNETNENLPKGVFLATVGFDFVNVTDGNFYFTDAKVREIMADGSYGQNLIKRGNPNVQSTFAQEESWAADYQAEIAKKNNVYLKVVIGEKQDVVYSAIGSDGTAILSNRSDSVFYGSTESASRTYQQYYWRYALARWGYATSIHSFEFCNEGNPFDGDHRRAALALNDFIESNDPNRHLTSSSYWHSFITDFFAFDQVDYGDWHKYITSTDIVGWAEGGWDYGGTQSAKFWDYIKPDYTAPPGFLHIINNSPPLNQSSYGGAAMVDSLQTPVEPNHQYTVRWRAKQNTRALQPGDPYYAENTNWAQTDVFVRQMTSWMEMNPAYGLSYMGPERTPASYGVHDWQEDSFTFTTHEDTRYLLLSPSVFYAVGEAWFDDITLYDDTAQKEIRIANNSFDQRKPSEDTAAIIDFYAGQIGFDLNRQVKKPVIIGETSFGYENDASLDSLLINDTTGVWYKKWLWAQINPSGVIPMYWLLRGVDDYIEKGFYPYAGAYQNFMAGIPLNNGKYADTKAKTSTDKLRAWGQKELTDGKADKAHLWIDNIDYTWKAVSQNNSSGTPLPTPVTGTVTIPDMAQGKYEVEFWHTDRADDPATPAVNEQIIGAPIKVDVDSSGNLDFDIIGLESDIAIKIEKTTASVNGTVTDQASNTPITSAAVAIVDSSNNTISSTSTNTTGTFALEPVLTDGSYTLKIAKEGYTASVTTFTASGSQPTSSLTNLDIKLTKTQKATWSNPNISVTMIDNEKWKITFDPPSVGTDGYEIDYYTVGIYLSNPTVDDPQYWNEFGKFEPNGAYFVDVDPSEQQNDFIFTRQPNFQYYPNALYLGYPPPEGTATRTKRNDNYRTFVYAGFGKQCNYDYYYHSTKRCLASYRLMASTEGILPSTIETAPLATASPQETTAPVSESESNVDTNLEQSLDTAPTESSINSVPDADETDEEEAIFDSQTTIFAGKVVDDTTDTAIANAEVTLYAKDSNIKSTKPTKISRTKTDEDGKYGFIYTKEQDKDYTVAIKAGSYQGKSFAIDAENPQTETTTTLKKATPNTTGYFVIIVSAIVLIIAITLLIRMKRGKVQ